MRVVDKSEIEHSPEHVAASHLRVDRAAYRVVSRGRRQHTGERRSLRNIDIGQRLIEVHLRGGSDTVCPLAEEHLVEEQLQDLLLAEFLLDAYRQGRFLEFAFCGLLERQEVTAGKLLGQRTAAACDIARQDEL